MVSWQMVLSIYTLVASPKCTYLLWASIWSPNSVKQKLLLRMTKQQDWLVGIVVMFLFSLLSAWAIFLEMVTAADIVPFAAMIPSSSATREGNANPERAETWMLARQEGEGHCVDSWKKPCDIPGYCAEVCCGYGNGGKYRPSPTLLNLHVEQDYLFSLYFFPHGPPCYSNCSPFPWHSGLLFRVLLYSPRMLSSRVGKLVFIWN